MAKPVSLVIPTLLEPARLPRLHRTLSQFTTGSSASLVEVVLVVNGQRAKDLTGLTPEVLPRVRLERLDVPSVRRARAHGRAVAQGEFIQFLDDDDELFEGAVAARYRQIKSSGATMVASMGLRRTLNGDEPTPTRWIAPGEDPQIALLRSNWNASNASMYRASALTPEILLSLPDYVEWTTLAFAISRDPDSVDFIPEVQYAINTVGPSLSTEPSYLVGEVAALRRMTTDARTLRAHVLLRAKLGLAYQDLADRAIAAGERRAALRWALQSLAAPGGIRRVGLLGRLLHKVVRPST